MSKRSDFIDIVEQEVINNPLAQQNHSSEKWNNMLTFWRAFASTKEEEKPMFTDNGKQILKYLQEHSETQDLWKARDIAEGLFISSRTVSGAMRKLVEDGFVEKAGQNPVIYSLTPNGKEINIDEEN